MTPIVANLPTGRSGEALRYLVEGRPSVGSSSQSEMISKSSGTRNVDLVAESRSKRQQEREQVFVAEIQNVQKE